MLLSCLSKAWLIYDANMASLSFLTDVQCDDLCRSEISISVVRMCSLHVSSRDRSRSSASLRLVSKEGQARAFSRLGFKGCYHLFCQIQQSPALWLASCLVRTLLFLFHSHSLRCDSISFRRYRRTWWTDSRAVAEDKKMGTDLLQTKAGSLCTLKVTHIMFWEQMLFLVVVGLIRNDQDQVTKFT